MHLSVARRVMFAVTLGLGVHTVAAQAQVTIGGVGYAQYGYGLKVDSSLATPGHDGNFDVTRAYLNVFGKLAHGVTTRITTDIDGRKAAANQLSIRLKYAFVGWTPKNSALTYKMGLFTTPWIDFEEAIWDYRMQGPTAFDRNGLFPSSDFGLGADGTWNSDQVNMQVGVFDGEGYANAPGDPGKDVEGRLSVRVAKTDLGGRVGGLRLSGYGQIGKATGGGTRQRVIGNLSYKSKAVTLVAEYLIGQDSTGATTPKQKSAVMSIYGVYNIPNSKAALLARLDTYDPNTDSVSTAKNATGSNKQTRLIGGISYQIAPNLRVLADVDLNSLQNGSTNSFDKSRQMFLFQTQFTF